MYLLDYFYYRKFPKFSYIKVADKIAYASSADPDQTAPLRSSLIRVYTVCYYDIFLKK